MNLGRTVEHLERTVADNFSRLDATQKERDAALEHTMQDLLKEFTDSRQQSQLDIRQVGKYIEGTHSMHVRILHQLSDQVDHLKNAVGIMVPSLAGSPSGSPLKTPPVEKSLRDRMDSVECLLYELLEKAHDPFAQSPPTRDMATSPHIVPVEIPPKVLSDASTQTVIREHHDASAGPSIPPAIYTDTGVSMSPQAHVDVGIDPRTPPPQSQSPDCDASPALSLNRLQSRFPSSPFRPELMRPADWLQGVARRDASQSSRSQSPSVASDGHRPRTNSSTRRGSSSKSPRASEPTASTRNTSPFSMPSPNPDISIGQLRDLFGSEPNSPAIPTHESPPPFSPPPEEDEDSTVRRPTHPSAAITRSTSTDSDFLARALFAEPLSPQSSFHSPQFHPNTPSPQQREPTPTFAGVVFRDGSPAQSQGSRKRALSVSERSDLSDLSSLSSLSALTSAPVSAVASSSTLPITTVNPASTMLSVQTKRKRNAANTSRKRRKTEPPPSKRQRNTGKAGKSRNNKAASVAPPRVPPEVQNLEISCTWPERLGSGATDKDFVQCDICDCWYHYVCVDVRRGDECLQEGKEFLCPPCKACRETYLINRYVDKDTIRDDRCARPDCDHPDFISAADEYFVERIIGRSLYNVDDGAEPPQFIWLLKWAGYDTTESSWQKRSEFPSADDHIKVFEAQAAREGLDLEDRYKRILLPEAAAAGWW
ncbi:hypothetical protein EIP91_002274 [Steccherinum ochraceum]|uniref:Chromo domain-containing protein n=1 Tax=Steccherinum ochraceum TaxID=92696 RepID=A0A4R0RT86_9APHY|nr:hypothetical protein EIP91_002274 [Steccherinum ochraceum]